ncbi:hypothetical protein R3I94_020412 [Phoxinus phoxinus]
MGQLCKLVLFILVLMAVLHNSSGGTKGFQKGKNTPSKKPSYKPTQGTKTQPNYPRQPSYPGAGGNPGYPNQQYPGRGGSNPGGYPNQNPGAGSYPAGGSYPSAGGSPNQYPGVGGVSPGGYPNKNPGAGSYPSAGGSPNQYPGGGGVSPGGYPNKNPGAGSYPAGGSYPSAGGSPNQYPGRGGSNPAGYDQFMNTCMKRSDLLKEQNMEDSTVRNNIQRDEPLIDYLGMNEDYLEKVEPKNNTISPTTDYPKNAGWDEDDHTVSIVQIGYPALIEQMKAQKCVELYLVYSESFQEKQKESWKEEKQDKKAFRSSSNHNGNRVSGVLLFLTTAFMLLRGT